jgi:hypothetical protein
MDWIESTIKFDSKRSFRLIHFDCVECPIVPGSVIEGSRDELSKCEDLLGSVLWLDAVSLLLPYLSGELLAGPSVSTALCLGEGTGAVGCGINTLRVCRNILITDLPDLLPILRRNAALAGDSVTALSLDWTCRVPAHLVGRCDLIIGCEVLYGNRFVWEGLLNTIRTSMNPNRCTVYICVTLRNKRHDLEDFRDNFLSQLFGKISEISLSDSVSVLKASTTS